MKLSVIVPTLTGELPRGLKEDPRLEIIVVKGISPVGRARNEGLRRATGDYIAWVDADDAVTEDWTDEILRALEGQPDVVVIGHTWIIGSGSGIERIWRGNDVLADVLRHEFLAGEVWNFIVRRTLWDGVLFDDTARTTEDWAALPRVLAKARRVEKIEKSLYLYCAHADSLTHQTSIDMRREQFQRALDRIDQVKELGLWKKYHRETMIGVGYAVFCAGEGAKKGAFVREVERWLRRNLLTLLLTDARLTYKVKWLLGACGFWRTIRVLSARRPN